MRDLCSLLAPVEHLALDKNGASDHGSIGLRSLKVKFSISEEKYCGNNKNSSHIRDKLAEYYCEILDVDFFCLFLLGL